MNKKEMEIQFCRKIQTLRREEKLSLIKLSERTGLPLEMLEKLDQGTIPEEMMVDDAFALAKVFGCEVYELFE